jgi:phenylacetic acid degradation operon negative regulatory protein
METPPLSIELSLFHKLLVYVEDKGKLDLHELEQFGNKRQTLGALGRLEGLNYIERIKFNDEDQLVLTDKGDTILASILSYLPSNQRDWDEKWRIILFDIPESMRTLRQMFRLKLLDLGARMLQSSVWITPHESVALQFRDIINKESSTIDVHIFEAKHLNTHPLDISALWNLPDLEREYTRLFAFFEKKYKALERSKNPSFEGKCLIVQMALVAKKDPNLPVAIMPPQWIGYEAQNWYNKIRIYCK